MKHHAENLLHFIIDEIHFDPGFITARLSMLAKFSLNWRCESSPRFKMSTNWAQSIRIQRLKFDIKQRRENVRTLQQKNNSNSCS
jgi:hypothetical protein